MIPKNKAHLNPFTPRKNAAVLSDDVVFSHSFQVADKLCLTVGSLIRLLHREQSGLGPYFLQFCPLK